MINKDTQICISVASRPSNFGTTLHNAAYAAMGLNFLYKAFKINDIEAALIGVRALNIRGCSVSMPFKEEVLPLLDELDETARHIGAVNTIVNKDGRLTGYNTDVFGARKALESINAKPGEAVLILGAGGAARAIAFALKEIGFNQIQISNRNPKRNINLNSILTCEVVPWKNRDQVRTDLLINATSVGMSPYVNRRLINEVFISNTRAVMDVVVSPMESRLIKLARFMDKEVSPGYLMSLEQTIAQFKLYTGLAPPREVMEKKLIQLI